MAEPRAAERPGVDMPEGRLGPRATAAVLSVVGFVTVHLVPSLKFPANPPSVGDPETIGLRTGLYFGLILISLLGAVAAGKLRVWLLPRLGAWNAALAAGAFYLAAMGAAAALLPAIDEVPAAFPAVVLWRFRVASIGAQALVWASIGLLFGLLAERLRAGPAPGRARRRSAAT